MMNSYHRIIKVLTRIDGMTVLYYCVEDLDTGLFAVQMASCAPIDASPIHLADQDRVQLYTYEDFLSDKTVEWFASLAEAIQQYERRYILSGENLSPPP